MFRIRISEGWRQKPTIGNYSVKANDLLSVFNCDGNYTICYEFEQPESARRQEYFGIQTALLYTTGKVGSQGRK